MREASSISINASRIVELGAAILELFKYQRLDHWRCDGGGDGVTKTVGYRESNLRAIQSRASLILCRSHSILCVQFMKPRRKAGSGMTQFERSEYNREYYLRHRAANHAPRNRNAPRRYKLRSAATQTPQPSQPPSAVPSCHDGVEGESIDDTRRGDLHMKDDFEPEGSLEEFLGELSTAINEKSYIDPWLEVEADLFSYKFDLESILKSDIGDAFDEFDMVVVYTE